MGILVFPLQTFVLSSENGLQKGIRLGIGLCFAGNLIRSLPLYLGFHRSDEAFVMYHLGQILIGASGPLCLGSVTRLSCVWFPESERTTATAIAQTSNAMGTTIGFLNPLWLVTDPNEVVNIFTFSLIAIAIPAICCVVYLPSRPEYFPSVAASMSCDDAPTPLLMNAGAAKKETWCQTFKAALGNRSFVIVVFSSAILSGAMVGWQSVLQSILNPAGISSEEVGLLGFVNGLATNVAAVASGTLSDRYCVRRLKLGVVVGLIGVLAGVVWVTLSLPLFLVESVILERSDFTLFVGLGMIGIFLGITGPLYYELTAELVYPVPEGMSLGVLVLVQNLAGLGVITLSSFLDDAAPALNFALAIIVAGVLMIVILFVKEEYKRPKDSDEFHT